jgi:Domain of unknown function (DUF397)
MSSAPEDGPFVWRKSTRSGGAGECVEVAELPTSIAVRDSKNPDGPVLRFGTDAWRDFIGAVHADLFDRPEH